MSDEERIGRPAKAVTPEKPCQSKENNQVKWRITYEGIMEELQIGKMRKRLFFMIIRVLGRYQPVGSLIGFLMSKKKPEWNGASLC